MKLLFDQNLSRHLVGHLSEEFPESQHVTEVGLDSATERRDLEFAGQHGLVIVSKDSDFRQLAFLNGLPPKAIWLQLGIACTSDIVVLRQSQEMMRVFNESEGEALLVIGPEAAPSVAVRQWP